MEEGEKQGQELHLVLFFYYDILFAGVHPSQAFSQLYLVPLPFSLTLTFNVMKENKNWVLNDFFTNSKGH